MVRRNKKQLGEAIEKARSRQEKALAYYYLGLFHDNDGREAEAIPNYLDALKLGLGSEIKAKVLAWLASSLYKTGRLKDGLRRCQESQSMAKDEKLQKFLKGLERRIKKSLRQQK